MTLDVKLDSTGFPMVYMQAVNAYVQWLPLTKIQIEYFLCSTNDAMFDETWYNNINQMNPRLSPTQIRGANYWQTIATGILPREAQRYAIWCGRGYDLPTIQEWRSIYRELDNIPADRRWVQKVTEHHDLKERTRNLIQRMDNVLPNDNGMGTSARTLADQMLFRQGVMEFVYEDDDRNTFAGLGLTNSNFVGGLNQPDEAQYLNDPSEGRRMRNYGFRLIYRG